MQLIEKRKSKIAKKIVLWLSLVVIGVVGFYINDQMGETYSAKIRSELFSHLSYYDAPSSTFTSPVAIINTPEKTTGGSSGPTRFFKRSAYAPKQPMPFQPLTKSDFADVPSDFAVYWLGHSTAIIELNQTRILIDPVFENAGPLPFITPRFQSAVLSRDQLPDIDVVIISHDHYDHLEAKTIKSFAAKNTHFVVPLGVGARLKGWGIAEKNITELGWHETKILNEINITACPSIHYSGRSTHDKNKTLWASYVLKGKEKNLYWSGDTGYGDHFKEIGATYGPFDVAFVEIDAWNNGWPNTHLFPQQAIQAAKDVKAKAIFPIHYAVFDLALHPWNESIDEVYQLAAKDSIQLITPILGAKITPGKTATKKWW